jgi:uncharacterized DUF497 family protein
MKYIEWDEEKNRWLIENRKISFDLCATYITRGDILEIIDNHSPYEHKKVFIINIDGYVYKVPYVEDSEKFFLKTIYPSRVATKKYLK